MRAASPPAYPRIIERIWILGLDIADVFGCIKQDVERGAPRLCAVLGIVSTLQRPPHSVKQLSRTGTRPALKGELEYAMLVCRRYRRA
jgi:hypothetical protein